MRSPADLDKAGRALWRKIDAWRGEHKLLLEPWEVELVAEVCRAVDRCAALRARMAACEADGDDAMWLSLVREERQQRAILGRVVASSGLPTGLVDDSDADKVVGLSPRSRRGMKAARVRWGHRYEASDAS